MIDNIIIGLFVVIVVVLHFGLYRWVKFKVDEGTIISLFKSHEINEPLSTVTISNEINMDSKRVIAVCKKSKDLNESDSGDSWLYKLK